MSFRLAKGSTLSAVASVADVVYCTTIFGGSLRPTTEFISNEQTTIAVAYIEDIIVESICFENTDIAESEVSVYIDGVLYQQPINITPGETNGIKCPQSANNGFWLPKGTTLRAIASVTDKIYCTVIYEESNNPTTVFLSDELTALATAYVGNLFIQSICLENTDSSNVEVSIYIDDVLLQQPIDIPPSETTGINCNKNVGTQGTTGSQGTIGSQGVQGLLGSQGIIGTQGTIGNQGTIGSQGTQGVQGLLGSQGVQGVQGLIGTQGTQGLIGTQGQQGNAGGTVNWTGAWEGGTTYVANDAVSINGSSYICILGNTNEEPPNGTYWNIIAEAGSQGAIGTQGTLGNQGTIGSQGTQGVQGLLGSQGATGSQGTQGIQGLLGNQGTIGSQGTQGVQGLLGSQGVTGSQGTQGVQGLLGSQGTQGVQGLLGTQGTIGSQGTQGTTGSQGTIGSQGTQGVQGNSGSSFNWTGDWESATAYIPNDVVSINGSSYICISDNTNQEPPNVTYWNLIASVGSQGTTGSQGLIGSQGTQGTIGSQGTQGVQGLLGSQGTTGSQGTQGVQGLLGIQGTIGSQGTQGVQGLLGSQGTTGSQGTQGVQGLLGTQGIIGSQGTQGVQGLLGSQGATGSQGTQGVQGLLGTQGIQGISGASGRTYITGTVTLTDANFAAQPGILYDLPNGVLTTDRYVNITSINTEGDMFQISNRSDDNKFLNFVGGNVYNIYDELVTYALGRTLSEIRLIRTVYRIYDK